MNSLHDLFRLVSALGLVAALSACATRVPLDTPERPRAPPIASQPTPLAAPPVPSMQAPVAPPAIRLVPGAAFMRPAAGPVLARFASDTNPGIDIGGREGDAVVAARDGRVVLVSSVLPNYGTMVVVRHDDNYISAYAHLGKTLVEEGAMVTQGQPIAEMGRTGNNPVRMRFEIRKMGAAVDPEPYLQGLAR